MHQLIRKALYNNHWLWFHVFAGGVLAKILQFWFDAQPTLLIILALGIIYEVYQWITREQRNFPDSVADVLGAFFMAATVVA